MKSMNEALQKYRTACSHKQALDERRRDIEVQRAQLASEQSAITSAIQRIRNEIQQAISIEEIREGRRRIADMEKDNAELVGLLGEPALSPAEVTNQINAATRDAECHRRVVFSVKLAEILDTDEAKSAKAFMARMRACLLLSGSDAPDMTPDPAMVAGAQHDLLEWLSDAAHV